MELINLTPHTINIVGEGSRDVQPSGVVARCSQTNTQVFVVDGIPVRRQVFGQVVDLPEPQSDTWFIVSRLVASACPQRHDLLIPGPLVRDSEGRPIGCDGLSVL